MTATVVDLASTLEQLAARVQQDHAAVGDLADFRRTATAAQRSDLAAEAAYLQARGELNAGRPGSALDLIEVARTTWLALGEPVAAGRTELGRMAVLDHLGRHAEALETGRRLLGQVADLHASEVDDDVIWMRGAANENIGVALGYLGRQAEALDAFTAAERLYLAAGRDEDVVRPLSNRGVELVRLGRFAEAGEALDRAVVGYRGQDNHLFAARSLAWRGRAHLGSGDLHDGLEATAEAAGLLADLATGPEWARTQLIRAETLAAMNLFDEAGDLYAELADTFASAGLEHDRGEALAGLAAALGAQGRTEAAAHAHAAAGAAFAAVGDEIQAARSRVARHRLIGDDPSSITEAVDLLAAADRPVELAETLIDSIELDPAGACAEVFDRARDLIDANGLVTLRWRLSFASAQREMSEAMTGSAVVSLGRALGELDSMRASVHDPALRIQFLQGRELVHHALIGLLVESDPAAALRVVHTARARTLVEQMHGTDRAVERRPTVTSPDATITYQLLGDEVMAFVERDGDVRVVRNLVGVRDLHRLLDQLRAQWKRFADPGLAARQPQHLLTVTVDLLQRLHLALLTPLGVDDASTLLIVPQGRLASVPFAALHDGVEFVVERTTIAMAPSVTAVDLAERRRRTPKRTLVLGVSDRDIPLAEPEARAIAAIGDGELLIGEAAEASSLTGDQTGADFDVVHVASHGRARPNNPVFSSVRLADRWVTAAELAASHYDGQVVVLSTCSSAEQHGGGSGEELDGLPRALLAAGAGGVVANLWPCADEAAHVTMPEFHRNLVEHGPAEALRRAQLATMRRLPHPYHWATSVWLGSPVPFEEMP